MPRPNHPRSIASERALATRIAHEREMKGWSYEGLAARMTTVGCPINGSAIFKIEKSNPPRRITVDELVALSRVLGIEMSDLVQPPEIAQSVRLRELLEEALRAADAALSASDHYKESLFAVRESAATADDAERFFADFDDNVLDELDALDTETDAARARLVRLHHMLNRDNSEGDD